MTTNLVRQNALGCLSSNLKIVIYEAIKTRQLVLANRYQTHYAYNSQTRL